jgi:hypothetical protein
MPIFLIVLLICSNALFVALWLSVRWQNTLMSDFLLYRSLPHEVVHFSWFHRTETQLHRRIDVKLAERPLPTQRMPYQFQYHEPLPMQGFTPMQNKSIIPARRRAQLKRVSGG